MTAFALATPRQMRATPRWAFHPIVAIAALAIVALGLRMWTPSDDPANTVCFVRRCTGYACPGCGLTRALAYLVRGDFVAMWAMHPLAPLVVVDAVAAVVLMWAIRSNRFTLKPNHLAIVASVHVVLLIGVWAARSAVGALPV